MNVVARPLSRKKIREMTRKFREMVGLENEPFFPVVHFIEWYLMECGLSLEIVTEEELRDTYGMTNTGTDTMVIREDVYNGAAQNNPRDQFTMCHEVAHFLLHRPESISYARGDVPVYKSPEWQANTFAAELMAPVHLIKNYSVEEIMSKCGMSRTAAQIQYNECRKTM